MVEEKSHICNSIKTSILHEEPFSHLYINNFFSKSFYDNLLKYLPTRDQYTQINKTKSVSANYPDERFIFNITPESFKNMGDKQKLFFGELVNSLMSKEFYDTIMRKFFSENNYISSEDLSLRMALIKDLSKYNLGAHTDTLKKFITFLFYIPEDDSHSHIGTSLYKFKDSNNVSKFKEDHFSELETKNLFNEVKRAQFLPNSVLIFPRTDISYHGVSSINTGLYERNLLLLNYNYK